MNETDDYDNFLIQNHTGHGLSCRDYNNVVNYLRA